MRGAHVSDSNVVPDDRIIPADAGSTYAPSPKARVHGDHPRGCGEHGISPDKLNQDEGSSPRMRGAQNFKVLAQRLLRIIPADAGSTSWYGWRTTATRDHPRGCGEHIHAQAVYQGDKGSSPRMRGARASSSRSPHKSRIIPADAGST